MVHRMAKPNPPENNLQEPHEDIETPRYLEVSRDVEAHVPDT
jgi:hypothetical protein